MDLQRNPFVASACEDIAEGRTRTVTVADLCPTPTTEDLDRTEEHLVTGTFWSLWTNLSTRAASRGLLLAVMHGITVEPRHPAYRVSGTGWRNVYQAQVGEDTTLVFKTTEEADQPPIWLAVLRGH